MKNITFIAILSLLFNLSAQAGTGDQGSIESISCINNEMNSDEVKAASTSFLGMKVGDQVLLADIRALAVNADGIAKEGMGLMESNSKLVLLVKAAGFCQKDKSVTEQDGSEKIISTVGTILLSIQK